jgi:hypothetical protein
MFYTEHVFLSNSLLFSAFWRVGECARTVIDEGVHMSQYDQGGAHDAPLSRDPSGAATHTMYPPATPQGMPPTPYGYGSQWELRPRRVYPIETKPFFLTSEFVAAALAIAGIAITAAASDAFGAWRAWILITAVVVGYLVSRGIAKSGTRSHADDPRENFDLNWGRGRESQAHDGR